MTSLDLLNNDVQSVALDLADRMAFNELQSLLDSTLSYSVSSVKLKRYFENLTENFANNQMSTCSYVSISSVLSYYDTYWHDNVIPENYDQIITGDNTLDVLRNSPGILYQSLNINDYGNSVIGSKEFNLQSKLLYLNDMIYSTTSAEEKQAISRYINYYGLQSSLLCFVYEFDQNMPVNLKNQYAYNYVKIAVNYGLPIILSLAKPNVELGHSVVAYDYDLQGNIFCHFGYKFRSTYLPFTDNGFNEITAVSIIVPRMEHSHSNNYKIIRQNNDLEEIVYYYCPCSATQGHTHDFAHIYENPNTHLAICSLCDETHSIPHTYMGLQQTCICGYDGNIDRIENIDESEEV